MGHTEIMIAEQPIVDNGIEEFIAASQDIQDEKTFITANTIRSTLKEIKEHHIIPVFIKDNEALISQSDFIETMQESVYEIYHGEHILSPIVRLSHPIKGRVPDARNKPANSLLESEKTIYYERMAFIIELPSVHDEIDGNILSLTVGGVKAYNQDNVYSKKGSDEHFKIFIGYKNRVCTNLCVWTDGYIGDLKVSSVGQLKGCINSLIQNYNANFHFCNMKRLASHSLTETQFANLVGRSKMYTFLPNELKKDIPPLLFGESQIAVVCKDYFRDHSFCRDREGNINLWKLYNLFTSANKSTYIDHFLDRSVNAFSFVEQIRLALEGKQTNWYLS